MSILKAYFGGRQIQLLKWYSQMISAAELSTKSKSGLKVVSVELKLFVNVFSVLMNHNNSLLDFWSGHFLPHAFKFTQSNWVLTNGTEEIHYRVVPSTSSCEYEVAYSPTSRSPSIQ